MGRLVAKKLTHVLCVLFLVSFVLTFLLDLAPGDPAYWVLGDQATPDQVAQVHQELGLDRPFYSRYRDWAADVVRFDFGRSYRTHENVTDSILQRLPVTAELVVLAFLMALIVSIPLGVLSAYKVDSRFDRAWQVISSALVATPPFVSSLLLVFFLSLKLHGSAFSLPATGWVRLTDNPVENLRYAFLPALALALHEIPGYSRLLRADMIATLQADHILAAKAKGLSPRYILMRHALRPSSFSLVTLVALSIGRLIGGSIIVESLFALPGLGQLLMSGILSKDVLVVQGVVMFVAISYVVINSATDLIYAQLDPRVRMRSA
jgi:peptide/nickel transport system permease protein